MYAGLPLAITYNTAVAAIDPSTCASAYPGTSCHGNRCAVASPTETRRVQVSPRHVADRVSHREYGQSKRERYAQKSNSSIGKSGGQYGCPAAAEH